MILDAQAKGIIGQPHLLDDVISPAPRFDLKAISKPIDGLMMGAVHAWDLHRRALGITQFLDVPEFLLGVVMVRNIEMQRPTQDDIEDLMSAANREDGHPLS